MPTKRRQMLKSRKPRAQTMSKLLQLLKKNLRKSQSLSRLSNPWQNRHNRRTLPTPQKVNLQNPPSSRKLSRNRKSATTSRSAFSSIPDVSSCRARSNNSKPMQRHKRKHRLSSPNNRLRTNSLLAKNRQNSSANSNAVKRNNKRSNRLSNNLSSRNTTSKASLKALVCSKLCPTVTDSCARQTITTFRRPTTSTFRKHKSSKTDSKPATLSKVLFVRQRKARNFSRSAMLSRLTAARRSSCATA